MFNFSVHVSIAGQEKATRFSDTAAGKVAKGEDLELGKTDVTESPSYEVAERCGLELVCLFIVTERPAGEIIQC